MTHRLNGKLTPTTPPRHAPHFASVALTGTAPIGAEENRPNAALFEPLLTNEEAAALLRIHPKTLGRMARVHRNGGQNGIPGYFYAHQWFFRRSELDGWLRTALKSA